MMKLHFATALDNVQYNQINFNGFFSYKYGDDVVRTRYATYGD